MRRPKAIALCDSPSLWEVGGRTLSEFRLVLRGESAKRIVRATHQATRLTCGQVHAAQPRRADRALVRDWDAKRPCLCLSLRIAKSS